MIFNLTNKPKTKNRLYAKSGAGFTIVETILAIALLSFGIISVFGAFANMVSTKSDISSRFTAAYLAQEGLEIIRNIRDNNFINNTAWSTGLTGSPCNTGCQADYKTQTSGQLTVYNANLLGQNSDGFYSYDAGGTPTIFKRKITTNIETSDKLKVTVLILWDYNGKSFTYTTEEYLYNWY